MLILRNRGLLPNSFELLYDNYMKDLQLLHYYRPIDLHIASQQSCLLPEERSYMLYRRLSEHVYTFAGRLDMLLVMYSLHIFDRYVRYTFQY